MRRGYKNSGVELIGDIPVEWEIKPIKSLVSTKITDGPHETPELLNEGIPFISAEAIKKNKIDFNKKRGYISKELHQQYSKKCKPQLNDIFIIKSGATTGNIAYVENDYDFNIWSPLAIVRSNSQNFYKFIFYQLLSDIFRKQVELSWSFGTQENIGMGVLERLKLTVPPLSEQKHIAVYLDKATSTIDKAVDIKKKQLEKLDELKKSVIYKAVTKGLDDSVKMKDSGIEWIGEIPEVWEVGILKRFYKIVLGKMVQPNQKNEDEVLKPYLRSANIKWDNIDLIDLKTMWFKKYELSKYTIKKEDLLVSEGGDIGRSSYITNDIDDVYYQNAINRVRSLKCNSTRFLYYCMFILKNIGFIDTFVNKITIGHLTAEKLEQLPLTIPPGFEQQKITSYLDEKTQEIETASEKIILQIEKLELYKKSLIHECVTGKRRVSEVER